MAGTHDRSCFLDEHDVVVLDARNRSLLLVHPASQLGMHGDDHLEFLHTSLQEHRKDASSALLSFLGDEGVNGVEDDLGTDSLKSVR